MKVFRITLLTAAFSIAATSLQAAPSLPITKPPVTPMNQTGPASDPMATNGQWFVDFSGVQEFRPFEFHDNLSAEGGGNEQHLAIEGKVSLVVTNAAGQLTDFDVAATIRNDTPSTDGQGTAGSNSHDESRPMDSYYTGTLYKTKLTAEFAIIDQATLPGVFSGPYRDRQPYIIADNEDQYAWYCWNEQDLPAGDEAGSYYVPTWDFGDIPTNQAVTRTLEFKVDSAMGTTDPRYQRIMNSYEHGEDIFANRTTSLKISTWIDDIGTDYPGPEDMLRDSDVSVFHDIEGDEPDYPHKMHWPQLPDPNGWDVRACDGTDELQKVLADDFRCTADGPITNIIFWGSFQYDEYNTGVEFHGIENIHLSLHRDIPAGQIEEWSMPEIPALWEVDIDPYNPPGGWTIAVAPEDPSLQGWYDPNHELVQTNNHTHYFRYEVTIPETEAFIQTSNTIYWLDVSVKAESDFMWGWKTSRSEHFMDDAVWADLPVTNLAQWNELRDPLEPEISLDLAFVIDGGEPVEEFDFGDLPDNFNTTLANNGANHLIVAGILMGGLIDAETNGFPSIVADGDDNNNQPDEDGVTFNSPFVPGQTAQFDVVASTAGQLDIWMELDGDGAWTLPSEHVFSGGVVAGTNPLGFLVPPGTAPGNSYIRYRFTSSTNSYPASIPQPFGFASDGEVEDYAVTVDELDWGDAPHDGVSYFYPTLAISNGANHRLPFGFPSALRLGWMIDGEPDGQPNNTATGDDAAGMADEDGVVFAMAALHPGTVAQLTVYVGVNTLTVSGFAYLNAWIDFNGDGDWNDAGEQIFTDRFLPFFGAVLAEPHNLTFMVPPSAIGGPTFARFRYGPSGLAPTGYASSGEVEDYGISIADAVPIDWGDAPDPTYPTLATNNGAHHLAVGGHLGTAWDAEADGQPNAGATGDDSAGIDDEDGVTFTSVLMPGGGASANVVVSGGNGKLDAWIDFNGDGDWNDPNEQIFASQSLSTGTNAVYFPVSLATTNLALPAQTIGRFRFSSGGGLPFDGLALSGEVEDYLVDIAQPSDPSGFDYGDAPTNNYPTLQVQGGARHGRLLGMQLGAMIDSELDGQPNNTATGDDAAGFADEDGIVFIGNIVAGTTANINASAGALGGTLDAWVDFNADGDWGDAGEWIITGLGLSPGGNPISFTVPGLPAQAIGPSFARFRLSTAGVPGPSGSANDGEVEDYAVDLFQQAPTNLVITNLTFNASNTVATVEWTSESGIIYQMQATTNLVISNSWVDVEATVLGPLNSQTNNMAAETNKFYRIAVPGTP